MYRHNTHTRYGSVAKTFHWLTALLILTLIPLGQYATYLADQITHGNVTPDADLISRTKLLFSLHKTTGVAVFLVALLRIGWALGQPKPDLLNGNRQMEALAAETVHWLLYSSLVIVPLSGWVHHAATTGFAPIWWPFGQSLPFVPKDEGVAEIASTLHYLFQWVLTGSVALHVAGALKHHVMDGDATLRRMLPGTVEGAPTTQQPGHFLPACAAVLIWVAVLLSASSLGWFSHESEGDTDLNSPTQMSEDGNWAVTDGTLTITVLQLGSVVTGAFETWNADITYNEAADANDKHGSVTVTVAIPSLSLGSVTDQAMAAGYLDAENHPEAVFVADLITWDGQFLASGMLTIKDMSVPVEIPFSLNIEEDTATSSGELEINRLDFGVGEQGEGSVAFAVNIRFELTATRNDVR